MSRPVTPPATAWLANVDPRALAQCLGNVTAADCRVVARALLWRHEEFDLTNFSNPRYKVRDTSVIECVVFSWLGDHTDWSFGDRIAAVNYIVGPLTAMTAAYERRAERLTRAITPAYDAGRAGTHVGVIAVADGNWLLAPGDRIYDKRADKMVERMPRRAHTLVSLDLGEALDRLGVFLRSVTDEQTADPSASPG